MKRRLVKLFLGMFILAVCLYIILWITGRKQYDVTFGISFNQNYAESLGLDWKEVYGQILEDLQPETIRIAAMWSAIEAEKGVYNFDDVDWMMNLAAEHDTKVLLVVGQKAPRWPECHVPEWIDGYAALDARTHLLDYVRETVARYHDHPALEYWQVENEAFIHFTFGECDGFQQDAVEDEIELVRAMDAEHKIVMTDSGELSTWRRPAKMGDIFGTTLYRVVQTPKGSTITYDWLPAGFYKLKARLWGKQYEDFFVAELQAEPWFTDSDPTDTPVKEQEKTMNPERMGKHIDYAQRVGASRAYLWGVEWWYFMKAEHEDERYWELAKETLE